MAFQKKRKYQYDTDIMLKNHEAVKERIMYNDTMLTILQQHKFNERPSIIEELEVTLAKVNGNQQETEFKSDEEELEYIRRLVKNPEQNEDKLQIYYGYGVKKTRNFRLIRKTKKTFFIAYCGGYYKEINRNDIIENDYIKKLYNNEQYIHDDKSLNDALLQNCIKTTTLNSKFNFESANLYTIINQ